MLTTDIVAPSSTITVKEDVEKYLQAKGLLGTDRFEFYDDALRAVWPGLHTSDENAAILLSISIYLECADEYGFAVRPDFLKDAKL